MDQDATDLLDERAALLGSGGDDARLDELTEALSDLLDGRDVVRRLIAGPDDELIARLGAEEPVHPARDAADLAGRVADDRRCFVLEHPDLPQRPLAVVWVALVAGIPDDLSVILDPDRTVGDPGRADTAVFYSIWNVEPGLVGLPLGHRLLDGAIDALREKLPSLRTAVTLSPIPGFRSWAEANGVSVDGSTPPTSECVRYLTSYGDDGRLVDPVARFHMGNGARLHAVAAHADRSGRGRQRSFGYMANYRYEPEDRAANRLALGEGRPAIGPTLALRER